MPLSFYGPNENEFLRRTVDCPEDTQLTHAPSLPIINNSPRGTISSSPRSSPFLKARFSPILGKKPMASPLVRITPIAPQDYSNGNTAKIPMRQKNDMEMPDFDTTEETSPLQPSNDITIPLESPSKMPNGSASPRLPIHESTDSNYYSELSKDGIEPRHRREVIKCSRGISCHKIREYQRKNFGDLGTNENTLFQFAICEIEQIVPRSRLQNAEVIFYSPHPVTGHNPTFQSGSKANKYMIVWQDDIGPKFIIRSEVHYTNWSKWLRLCAILLSILLVMAWVIFLIHMLWTDLLNALFEKDLKVSLEIGGDLVVHTRLND